MNSLANKNKRVDNGIGGYLGLRVNIGQGTYSSEASLVLGKELHGPDKVQIGIGADQAGVRFYAFSQDNCRSLRTGQLVRILGVGQKRQLKILGVGQGIYSRNFNIFALPREMQQSG